MLLKDKMLETYPSVNYFCKINNISTSTIHKYISGKRSVNELSAPILSKIYTALDCIPEDIGFTRIYWYVIPKNRKDKIKLFVYKL